MRSPFAPARLRRALVLVVTLAIAGLAPGGAVSAAGSASAAVTSAAAAADPGAVVDFENGVPAEWTSTGASTLSVTGERIQGGTKALRWDYADGDEIRIATGPLGNTNVWTGHLSADRSATQFPMHLPATGAGRIVVEFYSGNTLAASFEVPRVYTGWQRLTYLYSWQSKLTWHNGAVKHNLDSIRIRAVGTTGGGHLFLDNVIYNKPLAYQSANVAITTPYVPHVPDFSDRPAPTAADLANMRGWAASATPGEDTGRTRQYWVDLLATTRAEIATKGYQSGKPALDVPATMAYLQTLANRANNVPRAYADLRADFADEFLGVNRWLQEQGLVAQGSMGMWNNYGGRTYVDAMFDAREILAAGDRDDLDTTLAFLKWSYNYDADMFDPAAPRRVSMDYLHNWAYRVAQIAVMHDDDVTAWHHLTRWRQVFDEQLAATPYPDGSLFHHGFHHPHYAGYSVDTAVKLAASLTRYGMPVAEASLDRVRRGVERMRWWAGYDKTLLSLGSRFVDGRHTLIPGTFLALAQAYAPYRGGQPDADLMAAYLRLAPWDAAKYPGNTAEASPTGFVAMPFAGLGLHRREDWLAGVKGFSDFVTAGEAYSTVGRYNAYLSNGVLELQTHGLPGQKISVQGSGWDPAAGFDWLAPDGSTTLHSSLAGIALGNSTRRELNGSAFVGGLEGSDGNGMFALDLRSQYQANMARAWTKGTGSTPFTARKSYFFFDDRVIALGSGIAMTGGAGTGGTAPARTTLFQKKLQGSHDTVRVDGTPRTWAGTGSDSGSDSGSVTRVENGDVTLEDPYGNGYYVPGGDPVRLGLSTQQSRSPDDATATSGDYATAWIDHGVDPAAAGYEYAVLVQAEPAEVAAFASAQDGGGAEAPYEVLARTADLHAVHDRGTDTVAYAVYGDAGADQPGPLAGMSRPGLVSLAGDRASGDDSGGVDGGGVGGGVLRVSLTDPDQRAELTEPDPLTATIEGAYEPAEPLPPGVSVVVEEGAGADGADGEGAGGPLTRIKVPVLHGESWTVALRPATGENPTTGSTTGPTTGSTTGPTTGPTTGSTTGPTGPTTTGTPIATPTTGSTGNSGAARIGVPTPRVKPRCGPSNDRVRAGRGPGFAAKVSRWKQNRVRVTYTARPGYVFTTGRARAVRVIRDRNRPCR